ncbi:hypothetical protein HK104_003205 [Borealophlyctis nickersoniae]|nr:hypothetical protein HK104_003205 [Borealophlyctis nickersoniae]
MSISISKEDPQSPEAVTLIKELEDVLDPLYPSESRHGFSVQKLVLENVAFFLVRVDTHPAGCCGIKIMENNGVGYGELKRMYVRPEFRGAGLGKRMLQHLENYARDQGVPLLRLETGIHQHEAIRLYERYGFYSIRHFGQYWDDPLSLFYEKRVGG